MFDLGLLLGQVTYPSVYEYYLFKIKSIFVIIRSLLWYKIKAYIGRLASNKKGSY